MGHEGRSLLKDGKGRDEYVRVDVWPIHERTALNCEEELVWR